MGKDTDSEVGMPGGESLARKRGRVKASFTKLEKFVVGIVTEQITLIQIDDKLKRMEELLREFIAYDDILDGMTGYQQEFDEFEDRFEEVKTKLLLEKGKKETITAAVEVDDKIDPNITSVLNQLTVNQKLLMDQSKSHKSSDTYLPKILITQFSGQYKEWPTFKDQFETLVHKDTRLSDIQKFTHLRQFLGSEPLLLIQNMLVIKENYQAAWNKLIKRYENKRKIANSYLEAFFIQKIAKDGTADEISNICDNAENILSGLDGLDETANCRDIWLIYILVNKLDEHTKELWAEASTNKYETDLANNKIFPTITDFLCFLDKRRAALESIQDQNNNSKKRVEQTKVKSHVVNNKSNKSHACLLCTNESHPLYKCFKFKKLEVQERRDLVKKNTLCFNCLNVGHISKNCKNEKRCYTCGKSHHTILHISSENQQESSGKPKSQQSAVSSHATQQESASPSNDELRNGSLPSQSNYQRSHVNSNASYVGTSNYVSNVAAKGGASLLPTAQVGVAHADGNVMMNCKILLDSGSQVSFVTEELVQSMKLKRKKSQITVSGVSSDHSIPTHGVVDIKLKSRYNNSEIIVKAYILKKISELLPSDYIRDMDWSYLEGFNLADDTFNYPGKVDLLLGADQFFKVLQDGKVDGSNGCPSLINTMFGWVVVGNINDENTIASVFNTQIEDLSSINDTLTSFWELDQVCDVESHFTQTEEEKFCEEHFKENIKINHDGKFTVRLPFRPKSDELGNSIQSASKRLEAIENKMSKNANWYDQYHSFMTEYMQLGHMKLIPKNEINIDCKESYYLAHHAVMKSDSLTTKCRVVFDGSNKTSTGFSLNDKLAVGPTIQRDLQSILLNFRWYKIALCGDVEKMYRQVLVNENDQQFQRILWRSQPHQNIEHYRLCTVTYGTASAPFLATRTLKEIGLLCKSTYPIASKAIINDFYVDDFTSGADNEKSAIQLQQEVSCILENYGFPIRKWVSNSPQVTNSISPDKLVNSLMELNKNTAVKILGMHWQSNEDVFTFKVKISSQTKCTKRLILSEASKVFDPLGFLSPSIILLKIMLQELSLRKYDWDENLPSDLSSKWFKIRSTLIQFQNLKIPRWINTAAPYIELIGFSDASAVFYIKTIHENNVNVNILISKINVAPLKKMSTPRLELCGAWLLMKLYKFIVSTLKLQNFPVTAFTDSSVILSWLASHPSRWKTFVAFKTSQIIEVLPVARWKHVSSKFNPADCASRGISPEALINHPLWWHGPNWLKKVTSEWPSSNLQPNGEIVENESKKKFIQSLAITTNTDLFEMLFTRVFSTSKILRTLCYCKRMYRKKDKPLFIRSEELQLALKLCIKWAQTNSFHQEISSLNSGKTISKNSHLRNLHPFLDQNEILRIRGRIGKSNCTYDQKHPYIIPKNHVLATLLVREAHKKHLHAGPTLLMNIIRQKYWIIGLRYLVKKIVNNCIVCVRFKAQTCQQLMADLPLERITPSRPFLHTGVDYAGPFTIKGRSNKTDKAYLSLFVCFSSKATHLELVSDLTTESFIAAL